MNRKEIADFIVQRIDEEKNSLKKQFQESSEKIGYFFVDELLPKELAKSIFDSFPKPEMMKLKKSLREYKYIAAQMDQYNTILEEAIYAFQDQRVVELIQEITEIKHLCPDEHLYAGGISLMGKGQFLNPHLDNSHEKDRKQWRVLNLLYYVTPEWESRFGGNLEIWPEGVKNKQVTIDSLFNRLAVMATHGGAWHSVSPVTEDMHRACVSNYYFSDMPLRDDDQFHVTSFRGRPEQKFRDIILQTDVMLRQGIRKFFPQGAVKSNHLYNKDK
ncbi:2OG-Fe(II) oxygenase [Gimesia sp.]|uniref:2OG-Fe(II) oxygenase n=1 Tax=Gimesia sp. TaxID=2024833 RepID=UPI003A8FEFBF